MPERFPYRQVHLDFHTGPGIPDPGADFDPEEFARTMAEAHVASVTVFAKCHHGHLYYASERPERHPHLQIDLLGQQIAALHRRGIRAPVYLSVQCDEYAAEHHPDWIAQNRDGSGVGARPLQAGWRILDLASPYLEYLLEQTRDVLDHVYRLDANGPDGLFFDMCWNQVSWSTYRVSAMLRAGKDPESEVEQQEFSQIIAERMMQRVSDLVRRRAPQATLFFNSRPMERVAGDMAYQTQVEIEALPSGGWSYLHFPRHVRHVRGLGAPVIGMTARFHKSWADFGGLKPYAALEYETSQMLAHGARCSVGDQLHPRGKLDPAVYTLIERIYRRVEQREAWLVNATTLADIGVLDPPHAPGTAKTHDGLTRMLTQLRSQFDWVDPEGDLERYRLLILPDSLALSTRLAQRLSSFVKAGGKILATGLSALSDEARYAHLDLGIIPQGFSPYQASYFRMSQPELLTGETALASYASDHIIYDRSVRALPTSCRVLARIVEPYFDRSWQHFCSHAQTPGQHLSAYVAATIHQGVGYISFPVFHSYGEHGNLTYRWLIRRMLQELLPEPLLRVSGPSYLESTVQLQAMRHVVHLLGYSSERRTSQLDLIEDIVPLLNLQVSLRRESPPRRVYRAPGGEELPFRFDAGRVACLLPQMAGHEMLVFE